MKIALIYAFKDSSWFSCTKITGNLLKSYRLAFADEDLGYFNYDYDGTDYDVNELVDDLASFKPDKIVFLDHNPHPLNLISLLLKKVYRKNNLPEIIVHVFGCFTLNFNNWKGLGEVMRGKKIKFLCASDRQVNLVKQFFDNDQFIKKVPFPVDTKEFSLEKPNYKLKKKLGIEKDSKVVLYTGRLSLQKRIIELVDVFVKAHIKGDIKPNTYLLLAGKFDSFAFQFGNVFHHEGEYFRAYDKAISKYPKKVLEKVKFLGTVKNKELKDYYSIADLFASFSTYHDEDYGMSVAEAGACGCPLLLTDWAGFASFKKNESCQLIKTKLTRVQPEFDIREAYKKFVKIMNEDHSKLKKETAKSFKEGHSIEAVADLIEEYLKEENDSFIGFNGFLEELAYIERTYHHTFYNQMDRMLNNNYHKVYRAYVE
jgi:glycosyltransferase involved in cell wall biosynthesis